MNIPDPIEISDAILDGVEDVMNQYEATLGDPCSVAQDVLTSVIDRAEDALDYLAWWR